MNSFEKISTKTPELTKEAFYTAGALKEESKFEKFKGMSKKVALMFILVSVLGACDSLQRPEAIKTKAVLLEKVHEKGGVEFNPIRVATLFKPRIGAFVFNPEEFNLLLKIGEDTLAKKVSEEEFNKFKKGDSIPLTYQKEIIQSLSTVTLE